MIALSEAHDQLTRRHWQSADLLGIVSGATAPYLSQSKDRIVTQGEAITVTPRIALTLSLAMHELTTNAAKYGALSVPAGRIEVRWQIVRKPAKPALLWIEWRECGGPAVESPTRVGFGSRFIESSVATELRGKARLDFEATGLRCTMEIPFESAMPELPAGAA